jgi:hypothetical protein
MVRQAACFVAVEAAGGHVSTCVLAAKRMSQQWALFGLHQHVMCAALK